MPRISGPSVCHISLCILSLYIVLKQITKLLSLSSEFPDEIFSEIKEMNFNLFPTESGSHQTITPAIVHIVHTNMKTGLTLSEAAIARGAIKYGGADSVYIHSVVSLDSRYLDALLDDVMIKDQERVALLQINFKDNSTNFTDSEVVWAGLNALEAVGGVFLKPGVMLLDDMTNLLKFEAAVHWEEEKEYPDLVMAHPAARVLDGVRKLPDHHSMGEALALLDTGHLVKRFPDNTIQINDIITAISDGISFSDILKYKFVDINTEESLDLYDDENIKKSPSLVAALLRKAWFDTSRFIK